MADQLTLKTLGGTATHTLDDSGNATHTGLMTAGTVTSTGTMTADAMSISGTVTLSGTASIRPQTIAAATGTAIPVTHSGCFPITQNGAETNTLAIPTFVGQWLSIFVDTDTSGARVITSAQRINQAANTVITLTEVGDFIKLEAITIAGALRWQVVATDGAVLA